MPDYENYSISHNANGTITLRYTPSKSGSYRIVVECDGALCSGFPLCCSVQKIDEDFITAYEVENLAEDDVAVPEEAGVETTQDLEHSGPVADTIEQPSTNFIPRELQPDESLMNQSEERSKILVDCPNVPKNTNLSAEVVAKSRNLPSFKVVEESSKSRHAKEQLPNLNQESETKNVGETSSKRSRALEEHHGENETFAEPDCEPTYEKIKTEVEHDTSVSTPEPTEALPVEEHDEENETFADCEPTSKRIKTEVGQDTSTSRPEPAEAWPVGIENDIDEHPERPQEIGTSSLENEADTSGELQIASPSHQSMEDAGKSPVKNPRTRCQNITPKRDSLFVTRTVTDKSDAKKFSRLRMSIEKYKSPPKEGNTTSYRIFCCEKNFYGLQAMQKHIEENHKGADIISPQRGINIISPQREPSRRILERKAKSSPESGKTRSSRRSHQPSEESGDDSTLQHALATIEGKVCPICHKDFATKQSAQTHMKSVHYNSPVTGPAVSCEICNKSYRNKYTLQLHVTRMHKERGKYPCFEEGCQKRFNSDRDRQLHMRLHLGLPSAYQSKEMEICQLCGKTLSAGNLKAHIERKHTAQRDAFPCPHEDCGKTFKLQDDLKRHLIIHDESRKTVHCDTCGKAFLKEVSLRHHIQAAHQSEVKIPCKAEGCNKVFPTEHKLKAHMLAVHRHREPLRCSFEECNAVLLDSRSLKKHEMVHEGYRWLCTEPDCNQMFTQKHSLMRHINENHRIVPATIPCTHPNCDKLFKYKDMMKVHLRSHLTVRNFHCDGCGKSFKTRSLLTTHSKIHNKESHYKCQYCQESYARRYRLIEHLNRVHRRSSDEVCQVEGTDVKLVKVEGTDVKLVKVKGSMSARNSDSEESS